VSTDKRSKSIKILILVIFLEFLGETQNLLKKLKIVYKSKRGRNKAFVAEHFIFLIKSRLYKLLRGTLSHDWVSNLEKIVISMNSTPLKRLGYLMPDDINFEIDSVFVKESKENNGVLTYSEPDFHTQEANQKNALKSNNFTINSYVYLDFDEKLFDKSYDISVY
jgi:hypothetical protein